MIKNLAEAINYYQSVFGGKIIGQMDGLYGALCYVVEGSVDTAFGTMLQKYWVLFKKEYFHSYSVIFKLKTREEGQSMSTRILQAATRESGTIRIVMPDHSVDEYGAEDWLRYGEKYGTVRPLKDEIGTETSIPKQLLRKVMKREPIALTVSLADFSQYSSKTEYPSSAQSLGKKTLANKSEKNMSTKTLDQVDKENPSKESKVIKETSVSLAEVDDAVKELSNFIKVEAGETRLLQFFPKENIKIVQGEYQGQPTTRLHFKVVDPKMGEEAKVLPLSKRHAQQLILLLKKGISNIEVTRKGAGKNDTTYLYTPA